VLGIPLVVLVVAGLAVGLYLYVLTQVTAGLGDAAARRPQARLFAWPLRVVDRVNILVIGVDVTLDNRRQIINVARADTLVMLTIDPERGRIAAVSIPRDTRAMIPGVGETKINASYAYGGPRLTIRTVEQLLAVKVHYYVKLGPESFAHLIDAIGGLEVDVEKDMRYTDSWAGLTIDLKKGRQKLSGEQVTGYIRFRHDALGDIARVERQRKVMQTLVQRLKQPSVVFAAPRLLQAFARNTQTDLAAQELMALGVFALRSVGGRPIQDFTLPGTFAPAYWEPDFAKIRPMVADLFYGVSSEALAGTPVEVMTGTGGPAIARQAAARLREVGFRAVTVRTAPEAVETTTVISRMPAPNLARLAAAALGKATLRHDAGAAGAPITVIMARETGGKQGTAPRRGSSE
jgi:LCP family protein required for cell wall assembly